MRFVYYLLMLSLVIPTLSAQETNSVRPLAQAHAHNDYLHKRPLLDALDHGFCSVEADIFLIDGELQVGHFAFQCRKGRTIEKLYLDPLRKRMQARNGHVYGPNDPPFTLLVDIKTNGEKTFSVLHKSLARYKKMLTTVTDGKETRRPVRVVISGSRPQTLIEKTNPRYCGIDGRLGDLNSKKPAHLLPLISDRWSSHFSWKGTNAMPTAEKQKLQDIVKKAHQAGRRVRFWATPENENVWRELVAAKVDMLNTDKLDLMQTFLSTTPARSH